MIAFDITRTKPITAMLADRMVSGGIEGTVGGGDHPLPLPLG